MTTERERDSELGVWELIHEARFWHGEFGGCTPDEELAHTYIVRAAALLRRAEPVGDGVEFIAAWQHHEDGTLEALTKDGRIYQFNGQSWTMIPNSLRYTPAAPQEPEREPALTNRALDLAERELRWLVHGQGRTGGEYEIALKAVIEARHARGLPPWNAAPQEQDGGVRRYTDFADADSGRLYCGGCRMPLKADARGVYCDTPGCQSGSAGVPTVSAAGGEEENATSGGWSLVLPSTEPAAHEQDGKPHGHEGNPPPVLHERDEHGDWICCCGDHLPAHKHDVEVAEIVAMLDIPPIYLDEQVARVLHDARARLAALRRPVEQEVEGLVADVARCIPAPGAVCVEGFPQKATNVLVSVSLLERVLAALRRPVEQDVEGLVADANLLASKAAWVLEHGATGENADVAQGVIALAAAIRARSQKEGE